MTKKIILFFLFFFVLTLPCFSAPPPKPGYTPSANKPPSASSRASDTQRTEELKKMRERMEQLEARRLEELKTQNPAAYQQAIQAKETQKKISEIISSYQREQLNEGAAKSQLAPLVRKSLESRIKTLDREIQEATKRLEYLRKVKANPDLMVTDQINIYLGKNASEEFRSYSR